jgi:hypothetical protein
MTKAAFKSFFNCQVKNYISSGIQVEDLVLKNTFQKLNDFFTLQLQLVRKCQREKPTARFRFGKAFCTLT